MGTAFPPCPNSTDWKILYQAAILETNQSVIPRLVSEAERAILSRRQQLFGTFGTLEEKEALNDALDELHAFRTAGPEAKTA